MGMLVVKGLNQHFRSCLGNKNQTPSASKKQQQKTCNSKKKPNKPTLRTVDSTNENLKKQSFDHLNVTFKETVHWRKNLFPLPAGKASKHIIEAIFKKGNGEWGTGNGERETRNGE